MRQHVHSLVDEVHGCPARSCLRVHRVVGMHKVRDVGNVHTGLDVAVRQAPCVQGVVDVLAARRVDAADDHLPQILPPEPDVLGVVVLGRHDPVLALLGQTLEDARRKGAIRHLELLQQTLQLALLATDLAQRAYKVPLWIARRDGPGVDRDEELLRRQERSLTGEDADAGDRTRDRGGKDRGGRVGRKGRGRERGAVEMADVGAPVALDDSDDLACRLHLL